MKARPMPQSKTRHRIWKIGMWLCLVLVWAILTSWTVYRTDRQMRTELLWQAQLVAEAINITRIEALSGGQSDLETPNYHRLNAQLGAFKNFNDRFRSIYLIGRRPDGSLSYFVDSEAPDNNLHTAPKQHHAGVPQRYQGLFTTGVAMVEGPVANQYGTRVTGLVPLRNPHTDQWMAVLGMDIDAGNWWRKIMYATLPVALLSVAIMTLLAIGRVMVKHRSRMGVDPTSRSRYLELSLTAGLGLALTLFAGWSAHQHERNIHEAAFDQMAQSRTAAVAEAFSNLRDTELEGVAHFLENAEHVTFNEFQNYCRYLKIDSAVQAWGWIPAVAAEDKDRFESKAHAAGLKNFTIWQQNVHDQREPAAGRSIYYPAFYLSPLAGNLAAQGFDLSSEALRRLALENAAHSGLPTATVPITLVLPTQTERGIFIFRPIYRKGHLNNLRGFALAILRMGQLLENAGADRSTHMSLGMLRNDGTFEAVVNGFSGRKISPNAFCQSRPIFAFGKAFIIQAQAAPEFMRVHPARAGGLAATAGGVLTLSITLLWGAMLQRRLYLERQIADRTIRLRESEATLKSLVANIPGIFYRCACDKHRTMFYMSGDLEGIIGYPAADFINNAVRTYESIIHHEDRTAVQQQIQAAVNDGQPWEIEYRIIPYNGHVHCVFEKGRAMIDSSGAVQYLDGFLLDTTQRKQAEMDRETAIAALQERERHLELLMAANDEGLWSWEITDNILSFSDSLLRTLGFAEGDNTFSYQWFREQIHHDSTQVFDNAMADFIEGRNKYFEFVYSIKGKHGRWRWIWSRGSCTQWSDDGRPLRFMGTHRDITQYMQTEKERQAAQKALQEKSDELERYFTSSLDLLCIADIKGRFLRVNPEWENVLGYSAKELEGHLFLDFIHPDDIEDILDKISHIEGQNEILSFENRCRCKNGSYRWIEWRAHPHENLIYAVARDVTDRKKAEADLVETNRRLEKATARANEMAQEARQANRAKSEFLANMSHEIRTPMNAVISLSKFLMETRLDTEQRDYVNHIQNSSRLLMDIINNILDYSKIEADKMAIDNHPFCLADLLKQMKSLFGKATAEKGLILALQAESEIPKFLIGDALRLGQVLTNLLSNAVKFTEQGRVTLDISVWGQDDETIRLRFKVKDTGIGMDEQQISKLFVAFSQADTSTTRKYGGTGLGLAISSRLVEHMGGVLKVNSMPDHGSTFAFELTFQIPQPGVIDNQYPSTFDISVDESVGEQAAVPTAVPSFTDTSILLVEDNLLNQEVSRRFLEKTGAQVTVADNGGDAVQWVQNKYFDLILMDLQMPVMDGYEATHQIRKSHPELPVVALSAAVMAKDRQRAKQVGINAHLSKPIDENILYRTLARFLDHSRTPATVGIPYESPQSEISIHLAGFDQEQGMRSADGSATFYHRLLHHFKDQLANSFATISDNLYSPGDTAMAAQLVHALKGTASTVGHIRIANIATAIDRAFKEDKPISISMADELRQAIKDVQTQLADLPELTSINRNCTAGQGRVAMNQLLKALRRSELIEDQLLSTVMGFLDSRLEKGKCDVFKKLIQDFEQDAAADMLVALAAEAGETLT